MVVLQEARKCIIKSVCTEGGSGFDQSTISISVSTTEGLPHSEYDSLVQCFRAVVLPDFPLFV